MNVFVVGKTHIDALLTAGLAWTEAWLNGHARQHTHPPA